MVSEWYVSEPAMRYQSFRDLRVWQEARKFKLRVRTISKTFPAEERYRLTDQIIRSSRSVNASIAEGHGRRTYKDQHHFCIIARGSLSETLNHLIDAQDEEYIDEKIFRELEEQYHAVEALLNGYISYLRSKFEQ